MANEKHTLLAESSTLACDPTPSAATLTAYRKESVICSTQRTCYWEKRQHPKSKFDPKGVLEWLLIGRT